MRWFASALVLILALPVLAQPKPPALPPLNLNVAKQAQSAPVEAVASDLAWDEAQGVLAIPCEDRTLRVWVRAQGKDLLAADVKPAVLKPPSPAALTACAAGGGVLASASSDGKVILWDRSGGKPGQVLTLTRAVRALALACGSEEEHGRRRPWHEEDRSCATGVFAGALHS
jgi:WD40 repeat protein